MTVRDNFITNNCYMCVELNAHSLLAYIITIRDSFPDLSQCFTPWITGSQSAEKMFRSLRSMSSTFSTIVNFSMLGMLQRLHKLGIKEDLESESEQEHHDIHFARLESHKEKTGRGRTSHFDVCLPNEAIYDSLKQAEERAKSAATKLGMADDLIRKSKWDTPPIPSNIMQCEVEDDEEDEDEEKVIADENEIDIDYAGTDISDDLQKLKETNVIDEELFKKGTTKAKKICTPSVGIPTYENKPLTQKQNSLFVQVNIGNRSILIRKRTAVWPHNDGERVSSDRIFRVQPNEMDKPSKLTCNSTCSTEVQQNTPICIDHIVVGDFCVFKTGTVPKIGKALQFIKYDINGKKILLKRIIPKQQSN